MTAILTSPSSDQSYRPAEALLARLIPGREQAFRLVLRPGDEEAFEISGGGPEPVTVHASTVSALTAGFNWYLKHYAHAHVSWCGDRLSLPDPLPSVGRPVRVTAPYKFRYYFNYCTFSYSMAFWDWPRWEREIDWMALAGINLPLAVTGQEIVWQNVYRRLGLTDEEIRGFLAGPAFLAWGWMGNLDGWGGPSPQSWIDGQCALQKKILARQRELGMHPVLPAFTGHVPAAIAKKFPGARIKQMKNWAETFPGTYILDPADPLFQQIGHAFIKEQQAIYGTDGDGDHYYSCDTFNENCPPDNDPAYLHSVGRATYNAMAGADPRAVWVMQDWMFFFNPTDPDFWQRPQIEAYLTSVPADRLLVLDLHSDGKPLWKKTNALCGQPWVWCCLHSFGGHQSMHGHLDRLATDPPAALADPQRGKLQGFGLTMEGIEQNPAMYDLATDMMWRREAPDLDEWLTGYVHRRYGRPAESAVRAWRILRETVYSRPTEWSATTSTLVNLPPRVVETDRLKINYEPGRLMDAWRALAGSADEFADVDPYRFDLVDVGRQALNNVATALHARVKSAYLARDLPGVQTGSTAFLELLRDIDVLLATRREFLLGRWLEAAKAWGTNDAERRLMEWNARAQITLWHDRHSCLRDYARKEWAGMIRKYYRVRWQRYFAAVAGAMLKGELVDDTAFHAELRQWEEDWAHQTDPFPTTPTGDSIEVTRALLSKYGSIFDKPCSAV